MKSQETIIGATRLIWIPYNLDNDTDRATDICQFIQGTEKYRLEQTSLKNYDLYLVSHRLDRNILTWEATETLKEL